MNMNLRKGLKKEGIMKKNSLNVLLAIIIATGLAGCKKQESPPPDEVDVTQHDNWVVFTPDWGNPPLAFSLADHSITSGQPWGGVSTGSQGSGWGIDAKAGRSKTSGVANWFKSHASFAICATWPSISDAWPSELNFAFTGTLTINGIGYPITIGQGSVPPNNNWWLGGPGWSHWNSPFGDAVVTPDGKYYFEAADDTFNQFWIREKP
jgi:hypothetical protein